jgi:hypothetical protein
MSGMEQELEMSPIAAGNGKSDAAEQEQEHRPGLERSVSTKDGKRRSKLHMGAIITALFVRRCISSPLAYIHIFHPALLHTNPFAS